MSRGYDFRAASRLALANDRLQAALRTAERGFVDKRARAVAETPEFSGLRTAASAVREHGLHYLDHYLCVFEERAKAAGSVVHWARDATEARDIVSGLCAGWGARRVTKSKSMVTEEIELNPALEAAGFDVVETDLGEYIIQLARERPSHIIAPAVHKSRADIRALFDSHHDPTEARGESVEALVNEARRVLRERFAAADVGITGANFLIAETGSVLIVSNEGNVDLTVDLPARHIAVTGIEKVVPTLDDAGALLRVLGRSATGQTMTAYTTLLTGAPRDGGRETHIVLVDNGRSAMLSGEWRSMLRCIRCGACLNHCPVYMNTGGHAYGSVYPGPMGSVFAPLLEGLGRYAGLADASTLCGRCAEVCPVNIPLPDLLRAVRRAAPARRPPVLALWGWLARRPRLYAAFAGLAARGLRLLGGRRGRLRRAPGAGGWTRVRDLPAPEGRTFRALYAGYTRRKHGSERP